MTPSESGLATGYLHGFSNQEQQRLYEQALFLEPSVFAGVDFSIANHILEVGCGVGAQTEILLRRFPQVRFSCVDASEAQLASARERLAPMIASGRVQLFQADALKLPFPDGKFDGAFDCWLLEHVADPIGILREVRRVLQPGASIFINEVHNATFYLHPYSPATLQYWLAFNDHQWTLKGDPFIGAKLGGLLLDAGFSDIVVKPWTHHFDKRNPERRTRFLQYWTNLLLSGAQTLTDAGKVTAELVDEVRKELMIVTQDADSVFYYSHMKAQANA